MFEFHRRDALTVAAQANVNSGRLGRQHPRRQRFEMLNHLCGVAYRHAADFPGYQALFPSWWTLWEPLPRRIPSGQSRSGEKCQEVRSLPKQALRSELYTRSLEPFRATSLARHLWSTADGGGSGSLPPLSVPSISSVDCPLRLFRISLTSAGSHAPAAETRTTTASWMRRSC